MSSRIWTLAWPRTSTVCSGGEKENVTGAPLVEQVDRRAADDQAPQAHSTMYCTKSPWNMRLRIVPGSWLSPGCSTRSI
jgi:hypothetical protein